MKFFPCFITITITGIIIIIILLLLLLLLFIIIVCNHKFQKHTCKPEERKISNCTQGKIDPQPFYFYGSCTCRE